MKIKVIEQTFIFRMGEIKTKKWKSVLSKFQKVKQHKILSFYKILFWQYAFTSGYTGVGMDLHSVGNTVYFYFLLKTISSLSSCISVFITFTH